LEEPAGTVDVPPAADEHVDDLPVLIDGPVDVAPDTVDLEVCLVDEPSPCSPSRPAGAGTRQTPADLAARGLGVAILSQSMAERYRDRLTARTIDDLAAPAQLTLIWNTTHNPATRAMLSHARHAFGASDQATAAH
jgi:DNA-binding transcriptional LysR family regulator